MSTKILSDKKTKRATSKDENLNARMPEEKLKKNIYSASTPRNFIQKSSAADIYARKSSAQSVNAPKKSLAVTSNTGNESPMKSMLKSSPSSVSQSSAKSYKNRFVSDTKATEKTKVSPISSRNVGVVKKLPFTNTTANSPIAKRKINVDGNERHGKPSEQKRSHEKTKIKGEINNKDDVETKEKKKADTMMPTTESIKRKEIVNQKVVLPERKRTKTRTLEEEEIKILTPDVVDNNLEMLNLSKKLNAQPKAFYVELNEPPLKPKLPQNTAERTKESDEDVSYEEDFESYVSDFDSYQSELNSNHSSTPDDDHAYPSNEDDIHRLPLSDNVDCYYNNLQENDEIHTKEERMLDSGNFELRDPRKSKPMDYIVEGPEDVDKQISLTDEGFQEMSSSSGLSSMKTLHIDILDRPLFVDFTKSKENRRKRKLFERIQQRAYDILSMVTLHEMTYDLFEMKPIPYDLYMATFGRFNYTQTAVQTFEDGVTEEIQTDEILMCDKWTQNPIEFSNKRYIDDQECYQTKRKDSLQNFTFLISDDQDDTNDITDDSYLNNPLRIYLEQKDGAGTNKILPYANYKTKLRNNEYDRKRLRQFLKKIESKVCRILSKNSGNIISNLNKTSKLPFSNEYLTIRTTDMKDEKSFLNNSQIIAAIYSDTRSNLIFTVHSKLSITFKKCVLALWDLSVATLKPLNILIATDDVKIGRFKGNSNGFIVGALCDGTIQLWDLADEATWCNSITEEENVNKIDTKNHDEKGAENHNIDDVIQRGKQRALQSCAYTSSALNVCNNEPADSIVGLEFIGETTNMDYDRKILAQICALQSIGIITIWSVINEKLKNLKHDIGKALWSKMKLELNQTINLAQHIDLPLREPENNDVNFSLNSAKKRLSRKRMSNRNKISRPKSANVKCQDDSFSVPSKKKMVDNSDLWENGVECNHMKIMCVNGIEHYLIAKSGGEVLCCRREVGNFKVKTFCVTNSASSVTCLEPSPHGLPYFLAATNCGTVNMCSLLDYRVSLTLDCRNGPSSAMEKCRSDHKGRYLSSVKVKTDSLENDTGCKLPITSVTWLHPNPFFITATFETSIYVWELTHSDIRAKCRSDGVACTSNERSIALLTKGGELQVYKLTDSKENHLELFQKYVALL